MKSPLHRDSLHAEEPLTMELKARAKINWTLDITGVRLDGYHLLDMLMQPLELHDTLYLRPADTLSLQVEGMEELAADSSNLVIRAAIALQQASGCTWGAEMKLIKRIPMGAGLGGGSADAAAALKGLNDLWGLHASLSELQGIGEKIGADIPFCLEDSPQRVQGIGEKLTPIQGIAVPLLLIQPCAPLSTKEVFAAYHLFPSVHHPDTEGAVAAILQRDLDALRRCAANVLEHASIIMRPEIAQAKEACYQAGAGFAQMTGSGSAVFAAFYDESAAQSAYERLCSEYAVCLLTRTAM